MIEVKRSFSQGKGIFKAGIVFSARQLQVLALIAEGCTDKEIGLVLGISQSAVNYQVGRLIVLMEAKNRTHAACNALRKAII